MKQKTINTLLELAVAALVLLTIGLASSSCSPKIIESTRVMESRIDTVIVRQVEKEIHVPAREARGEQINIDSIVSRLKAGIPPAQISRETFRVDPETKMQVGILIDELGNLTSMCEQQDRYISVLVEEIERYTLESKETHTEYEKVRKFNFWTGFFVGAFAVCALGIVFLLFRR